MILLVLFNLVDFKKGIFKLNFFNVILKRI